MSVPSTLEQKISEALSLMQSDAEHHLKPTLRRTIYDTIEGSLPGNNAIRGHLAILAARNVLPIFQQAPFPSDEMPLGLLDLPNDLLELADKIIQGTINSDAARQPISRGTESFGLMLTESHYDTAKFPVNAVLAGIASHNAILEVIGWDAFKHIEPNIAIDWISPGHLKYVPWESLTDDILVMKIQGDTASAAAVAWACDALSSKCDPKKLQTFWEWWLTEAIPQARKMAESSASPT